MSTQIISLATQLPSESSTPAPDRLVAGTPIHTLQNYYSDTTNQFFAGRWSSTPGAWRVRYTEHELCVITHGKMILKGDDGTVNSFGAGDAFIVPAGFSGIWEVVEHCTKIYAIFEKLT